MEHIQTGEEHYGELVKSNKFCLIAYITESVWLCLLYCAKKLVWNKHI